MGGTIIAILVNLVIYGIVVLVGYLIYKKYDKKLLEGKAITEKQMLLAIVGALFGSVVASNILHLINYFLLGSTRIASIVGLFILVAQFYAIYYGIIFLLEKQKVGLKEKVSHLLSHKISFIMIITLVVVNMLFQIAQALVYGIS